MRRLCSLLALTGLLMGNPAQARPINLLADSVSAPGHVDWQSYGYYAPVQLKVIAGSVYTANPVGQGYHWLSEWNNVEVGVLPSTSLNLILPADAMFRFDGSDHGLGPGDVGLGLSRQVLSGDSFRWRTRLRTSLPTGDATHGLGAGTGTIGFDNSWGSTLWRDRLFVTANANYTYYLRTTQDDPASGLPTAFWRGQSAQGNLSLEFALTPALSAVGEVLATVDSASEQNRQGVATSGDYGVSLAPGVSYMVLKGLSLMGAVLVPVVRGGYQDSYQLEGMVGALARF
jgi:hypothetical protein